MLQPGETLFNNKYRIERLLGQGAAGQVYLATHLELEVPRAIKVLRKGVEGVGSSDFADFERRFQLEARLGANLKHPNLVQVYDFERGDDLLALVMEYCPGGSLQERIDAVRDGGKPIPIDEVVRIGVQVAEGLAALHHKQIVHRDLKPSNVLFDAQGVARVADLGLAQVPGGPSRRSRISKAPPHPGTPGYMSPEQEGGRGMLTPASDVYALGLLLIELLTGRMLGMLKPGTRLMDLRPDVPDWLDRSLGKMLVQNPKERRPWDGAEAAELLQAGQREAAEQAQRAQQAAAERERQARAEQEEKERKEAEQQAKRDADEKARREAVERERRESDIEPVDAKELSEQGERNKKKLLMWISAGTILIIFLIYILTVFDGSGGPVSTQTAIAAESQSGDSMQIVQPQNSPVTTSTLPKQNDPVVTPTSTREITQSVSGVEDGGVSGGIISSDNIGSLSRLSQTDFPQFLSEMDWSSDGEHIALAGAADYFMLSAYRSGVENQEQGDVYWVDTSLNWIWKTEFGENVEFLRISPDDEMLAVANGNMVYILSCSTGDIIRTLGPYSQSSEYRLVQSLDFSPDGEMMAISLEDGRVILVTIRDWKEKAIVYGSYTDTQRVTFSPHTEDGLIATIGMQYTRLWNYQGAMLDSYGVDQGYIFGNHKIVEFTPDGRLLAVFGGNKDRNFQLWDIDEVLAGGFTNSALVMEMGDWMENLSFSPDGSLLAAMNKSRLTVWDVKGNQPDQIFEKNSLCTEPNTNNLLFSPDGTLLAIICNKSVQIWGIN